MNVGGARSADGAPFRALVVDDEQLFARAIGRELARNGVECDLAFSAAGAQERARTSRYGAILLDHKLPDDDGIRMIPSLLASQPGASVIVMTAYQAIASAIHAIRQGAEDYLVKETSIQPLVAAVLEVRRRRERPTTGGTGSGGPLGRSPAVAAVREQIERVARRRETTVLLTGETGAGKEVAARWLHSLSAKPDAPFIAVDCVALPSPLVESLLFGHEKGSFTGADRATAGAFEEAGEGTIFLDEIGEMDLSLQGKLLRVIESRCFQRVGSVRERPVRARVVAATNRDLLEQARRGAFRFDLYQRLSVFPVHVPALRERGDDVLLLADHFLRALAGAEAAPMRLSPEVGRLLVAYDFPGNVRELRNVIERATILCDAGQIERNHLPDRILRGDRADVAPRASGAMSVDFVPGVDTLDGLEKRMIAHALERAGGVKAEAARLLGISRFQLLRRIDRHGLGEGTGRRR